MEIFDLFKKGKSINYKMGKASAEDVFFKLCLDASGAFIMVANKKGQETAVDYQMYSGNDRNVLRTISNISTRNAYKIDWSTNDDRIYLHDHDYLLEQLRLCPNFVNEKMEPLSFESALGSILLEITDKDSDTHEANLYVSFKGQRLPVLIPVNETYVLHENKLIEVKPLGPNFKSLPLFKTAVRKKDLRSYLSLLFSHTEHVQVIFEEYQIIQTEDSMATSLSLVIEKVDTDESLYMRLIETIPGLHIDFLEQFDVHKSIEINELEKQIKVKYIQRNNLSVELYSMERLLNSYASSGGRGKKKMDESLVVQQENLFILKRAVAETFIYQELPKLLERYQLFGAEKLKSYKLNVKPPRLELNISSGIDFLEGDATLDFGTDKISLFEAIQQFQKNRYIQLSDGSHAILNQNYLTKLQRIFKKKKDGKIEISFFDLPLVQDLIDEKITEGVYSKSRTIFEGFNNLSNQKPKIPKLNAQLRDYQKAGFQWLEYLSENKLGGCLADDMGLGKTIQTIALLSKFYPKEKTPTLIVMPKSLLSNWGRELAKFSPSLKYYTYYQNTRDIEEAMSHHIILTTYAMVRNDVQKFKDNKFFYIVLDESQNIKNLNSQTNKAITILKSHHKLALSGTPLENNLSELYALFRFLNPAMFGGEDSFNNNYLLPIQKYADLDATNDLRRKIYPFILRRLKKDVLKELPDKIEQVMYIEMSDEQRKLYEQRRQFYKAAIEEQVATKGIENAQFFIFQALSELRQIASIPESKSDNLVASPKVELLVEQLSDVIANGHKALVFVNFLTALDLIGEELDKQGIDFVSMSGSTRDRQSLVDRFQNDPHCKVFLMTLKTGGTGLNLTAADTVFIFDPWWNKAAESQAIDRAHRIGQTRKVLSYKLITQDTIEEKILLLQEKKSELFNNIISADASSLKSLSAEDINFILK